MAQLLDIPLPTPDEPLLVQSTQLEGRTYRFSFDYNSRLDRWTFSLATEAGDDILSGALLCCSQDLLRTVPNTLSYAPPGQLFLVGANDPTLETISDVSLVYLTSE